MPQRTNLSMPPRERTDLNMTRRLTRFIRLSGLPLTGPAHQLRMDFVRATHALCILQRTCTRGRILQACCELLEGWAEREEPGMLRGAGTLQRDDDEAVGVGGQNGKRLVTKRGLSQC